MLFLLLSVSVAILAVVVVGDVRILCALTNTVYIKAVRVTGRRLSFFVCLLSSCVCRSLRVAYVRERILRKFSEWVESRFYRDCTPWLAAMPGPVKADDFPPIVRRLLLTQHHHSFTTNQLSHNCVLSSVPPLRTQSQFIFASYLAILYLQYTHYRLRYDADLEEKIRALFKNVIVIIIADNGCFCAAIRYCCCQSDDDLVCRWTYHQRQSASATSVVSSFPTTSRTVDKNIPNDSIVIIINK